MKGPLTRGPLKDPYEKRSPPEVVRAGEVVESGHDHVVVPRLRTTGVNTIGAPAKVMSFDRLGKKVRRGTFGKIRVG